MISLFSVNVQMFVNVYSCLPAPDNVFLQQLLDDVDDVGHIDFVNQTVDGLLQSLPAHPLIGQAAHGQQHHTHRHTH